MEGEGAWAREHRDKNRNRDTGTVIGVGPEVKGPRHRDRKGNQSRHPQGKGQEQKHKEQ